MDFTDLIPKKPEQKSAMDFSDLVPKKEPVAPNIGDMDMRIGGAQGIASIASGTVAAPVAGLSGIGVAIAKSLGITDADPAEVIKKVNHALTYEPPSKTGQKVVDVVSAPFEWLAGKADKAGSFVAEKTDSPLLGAAVNTGIQALPLAIGRFAKKATKITDTALAKSDAATAIQAGEKAVFNQIADTSKKAGYTVPPSELNPSVMNKTLEGVGDKGKVAIRASVKNQPVTDGLVRQDIGLESGVPATRETISAIRAEASKAYDEVKKIPSVENDAKYFQDLKDISKSFDTAAESYGGVKNPIAAEIENLAVKQPTTAAAIEMVKILRGKADYAYRQGDKALGKAYKGAAEAIDSSMDRYFQGLMEKKQYGKAGSGQTINANPTELAAQQGGDLVVRNMEQVGSPLEQTQVKPTMDFHADPSLFYAIQKYQDARQLIAKTYMADKALKPNGSFDASVYAKALEKGAPLSGPAKVIGEFAASFPRAAKMPQKIGGETIGLGDVVMGGAKAMVSDNWLSGAATLGVRPAVRATITSKPYQSMFVNPPDYGKGLARRSLSNIGDAHSNALIPLSELAMEQRK
jgi:hypothetical protein